MMRIIAPTITRIAPSKVVVPEGRRPLNAEKLKQLTDSLSKLGLLQPITVHEEGGRIRLVAGHHRLAAAMSLGWTQINATFLVGDDVHIRLAEIAENLHRAELSALERDELLSEWIILTEKPEVSSQVATKPKGGRPEGGVRAAARELGVSKDDASRALKVAGLAPEAKAVATEVGLADNRSALLDAAKETAPARQVEALKKRAQRKSSPSPSPSTSAPANPIAEAWRRATRTQRREFALSYRTDIMLAQQRGGSAGPAADRAEAVRLAAEFGRTHGDEAPPADDGLDIPPELRRGAL